MPKLSKKAISKYIRSECKRQFCFYLYPDNNKYKGERDAQNMPPRQPPRPGVNISKEVGLEWEKKVYNDILEIYGESNVILNRKEDTSGYGKIELLSLNYNDISPGDMILQGQYNIPLESSFEKSYCIEGYREKYNLNYSELIPDIIHVLPNNEYSKKITPDGRNIFLEEEDYQKLQLRIIDIKNVAEPSSAYFAEVAYYMITLSGWLKDNNLDDKFIVVDGAVWPGSHEGSNLRKNYEKYKSEYIKPNLDEINEWLKEDLEPITFSAFSSRLKSLLKRDLEEVLQATWEDFPFHISSKCSFCDYFGYKISAKLDDRHCRLQAQKFDHLSRIANISKGAAKSLIHKNIKEVKELAKISSEDKVLNSHHTLISERAIIPERAKVLSEKGVSLPENIGSTSIMPNWSDLSICISVDFDISSGITVAFGLKAFWIEPYKSSREERLKKTWPSNYYDGVNGVKLFIIDKKDIAAERREFLSFLRDISQILYNEDQPFGDDAQVQVYIWDDVEINHLQRLVGRYLPDILEDPNIENDVAWLFPSEESVESYRNKGKSSRGSSRVTSPVTVVKKVINNLVALPIPYYYSLLETARSYSDNPEWFNVDDLFEDMLSDQIPSERAHEIWSRSTHRDRNWNKQLRILERTVATRINALDFVRQKLRDNLSDLLKSSSPKINNLRVSRASRLSKHGQIWYAFAKLNANIDENDKYTYHVMPAYKREAKLVSARLRYAVEGDEKSKILDKFYLKDKSDRRVYKIREESKAVKLKEGDFLCCLSPREDASLLHDNLYWEYIHKSPSLEELIKNNCSDEIPDFIKYGWKLKNVTQVTIKGIDRDEGYIIIDIKTNYGELFNINFVEELEKTGVDFSKNISLDPIHQDFFTDKKLLECLQYIGNPKIAKQQAKLIDIQEKLGLRGYRESRDNRNYVVPAAHFLWDVANVRKKSNNLSLNESNIKTVREILVNNNISLNKSQWDAWDKSLKNKLQVIWGPPGTGKSRTLRSIIMGLFEAAKFMETNIRVLVTSSNYKAIDNVLVKVYTDYLSSKFKDNLKVRRLRSSFRDPCELKEIDLEMDRSSKEVKELHKRLKDKNGLTLVGATPGQIFNFITLDHDKNQDLRSQQENNNDKPEFFDFLIIDEASQLDVAHSILPLCSLSNDASIILAGDPLQLPPIHQAEAPLGLESMVGSIYEYMVKHNNVVPIMLNKNYRSNKEIVEFTLEAGYDKELISNSPDLKLHLNSKLPIKKPYDWPKNLFWTTNWSKIMDPDKSTVCFVYEDGLSSQWNDFEVDTIASLIKVIYNKIGPILENQIISNGMFQPIDVDSYDNKDDFWRECIGIVTPHNAQKSKIIDKLQKIFKNDVSDISIIRDAVDTVERFQGQERQIMLASFALGDPDMILQEEEFLMNLNRFNVMASRAQAKLIVIVSQEVVDYLANDLNVLKQSRLIKVFAEEFCEEEELIELGYYKNNGILDIRKGFLRYKKR